VERYQVAVTPDPTPSCTGSVFTNLRYICFGLSPDTDYTFTVSAINCGDQEGESSTFSVQPRGLGMYNKYDMGSEGSKATSCMGAHIEH
jgi:hypothetical protein